MHQHKVRLEKVAILDEVIARVKDSDYCFILNHGGVTVAQFAQAVSAIYYSCMN